jgi:hypothetical protein
MRRFTLSPVYQMLSKSEFAKNLPKARQEDAPRLLSSTALSSIHTRLIPRNEQGDMRTTDPSQCESG